MRAHKFRAWHKKYKKMYRVKGWIQGDYGEQDKSVHCVDEQGVTEVFADGLVELLEYTGLTDKNGREIYEGDIVKYGMFALNDVEKFGERPWEHLPEGIHENDISTVYLTLKVKWNYAHLCDLEVMIYHNPDVVGVEVIGNIYENPELALEGV